MGVGLLTSSTTSHVGFYIVSLFIRGYPAEEDYEVLGLENLNLMPLDYHVRHMRGQSPNQHQAQYIWHGGEIRAD
jgi:hypothetical protein